MSLSVGALIWISVRPLIRLAAGAACGYIATKADILPPVATRGLGQIALNITMPCLLFSSIVPAFSLDRIDVLGPLVLVALLYEALGIVLAWLVRYMFWVPHRFRWGILISGGFGNVGDLATAVILSITANAPFRGPQDQNLAVAYISAFILVFSITLFPMGFHHWIAWDFLGPDVEPEVVKRQNERRRHRILASLRLRKPYSKGEKVNEIDEERTIFPFPVETPKEKVGSDVLVEEEAGLTTINTPSGSRPASTSLSLSKTNQAHSSPRSPSPLRSPTASKVNILLRILATIKPFILGLFNPVSVSIYVSFPIALVPTLKALFLPDVPGASSRIPNAPDGLPPLNVIMDIAKFIGAASVPIGLICLGSCLARLHIPVIAGDNEGGVSRGDKFIQAWRRLPVGAIGWLAIMRVVVMPVLGVIICRGLIGAGVINRDDKVLQFVCMFLSCIPTATTQVYLTQVYSGTGEAEHVAAFLIPQYVLMFISMTALSAYTINTIF